MCVKTVNCCKATNTKYSRKQKNDLRKKQTHTLTTTMSMTITTEMTHNKTKIIENL